MKTLLFVAVAACLLVLITAECKSRCHKDADPGPCDDAIDRYFYNSTKKRCQRFTYGGCEGNSNNFKSLAECQKKCDKRCSLPPEKGPCEALIKRYFYNSTSKICEIFTYGGCDGNKNNYETLEKCRESCAAHCHLEPEVGNCRGAFKRYYFNPDEGKCKVFSYGGCGGNDNNFETEENCERSCGDYSPDPPPKPDCSLPKVVGPCKAAMSRYFYNTKTEDCEKFTYGGCKGNSNNFETEDECEKVCENKVEKKDCSLPVAPGPCYGSLVRYFYNSKTKKCEKFIYGGCQGNANNFKTIEECEKYCCKKRYYVD